jgi:hypothetical protein
MFRKIKGRSYGWVGIGDVELLLEDKVSSDGGGAASGGQELTCLSVDELELNSEDSGSDGVGKEGRDTVRLGSDGDGVALSLDEDTGGSFTSLNID